MLVLSRKLGESIVLPNDDIKIRVLEIRGNQVRLGFEAPDETEIHREEVWCRLENIQESWKTDESYVQNSYC